MAVAHAHHFLRRLDRLDSAQVARALTLSRDHDFTRELLRRLRLPDRVARVGVSLDDPARRRAARAPGGRDAKRRDVARLLRNQLGRAGTNPARR